LACHKFTVGLAAYNFLYPWQKLSYVAPMAEETVWTGTSSQVKNLGAFTLAGFVCLAIVAGAIFLHHLWMLLALLLPLAYAGVCYLKVASREYRLTTERLLVSQGILSKTTDTLELYRVKDLRMTQSFAQRLFNLENIEMLTSDKTDADLVLDSVPKSAGLGDQCRNRVEACRAAKGTREIEVE
jgi:uncharacterized membrane protein YdbT with pleckstrin-like domain